MNIAAQTARLNDRAARKVARKAHYRPNERHARNAGHAAALAAICAYADSMARRSHGKAF